jgi:hypothetical protein
MAGPNILNIGSKVVFLNGQAITLPSAASNPSPANPGDMYYNSVSNTLNYYNGTTWINLGSNSTAYTVNTFVLNAGNITNQYVTLSSAPDTPSDTILTVIGGPMQLYGTDFNISGGTQLNFINSLASGGHSALVSGDILVIQYN